MADILLDDLSRQLQQLLERQRNYEAGLALGRHILQYYPRHLQTYRQMGLACVEAGLYADAMDVIHRALSADPEDGALWSGLRQTALALGLQTEAANAGRCQEDISGAGTSACARAHAAAGREDWAEAAKLFQQAFHRQPERMDIALGLATAYLHLEELSVCRSLAEMVLQQLPYSLKAHWLLVRCAVVLKDSTIDANAHLATARSLDPDDIYAWRWFVPPDRTPPPPSATLPAWDDSERWPLSPGVSGI